MKRFIIGAFAVLGIAAIAVAGLSIARPDLLSKLGMPTAQAEKVDHGLYCKEHGVPEKFCTLCHPELKEKLLLCTEHGGLPEDICTKCHPESAEKYDIKPCEHGLPAHFCPTCHPENFKEGGSASADPNLINDGWCEVFGEKGPDGKIKYCKLLPMVRLASAELASDVGLGTASVVEREHARELSANAETAYDANRYAEINPRVRGYVREARVDLGRVVKAGEVLAVIDSPEVSSAKTHYISSNAAFRLADDTLRRVTALAARQAVAAREEIAAKTGLNQAKASLLEAEQRLRNFGFDDAELKSILQHEDTRPLLEVASPIDGTVILRHAVLGEAVEPTANLYTVADTSKLWLWVDVYERDVAAIRLDQPVTFTVSGISSEDEGGAVSGRVTWVGAGVDEKTRTTKIRAELPNPDGLLRAHQFGKARVRLEEPHQALTLAKAAIQRYENAELVFLTQKGASYRPQRIKTRPTGDRDLVEVTWGLQAGQEVVTDGSFLLKTEIMKGSIGAGCCD